MSSAITHLVDDLLDEIVSKGNAISFMKSPAPCARVFLSMMGPPQSRVREFIQWARTAMDQKTEADDKVASMCQIADFLAEEIETRKSHPKDNTPSSQ